MGVLACFRRRRLLKPVLFLAVVSATAWYIFTNHIDGEKRHKGKRHTTGQNIWPDTDIAKKNGGEALVVEDPHSNLREINVPAVHVGEETHLKEENRVKKETETYNSDIMGKIVTMEGGGTLWHSPAVLDLSTADKNHLHGVYARKNGTYVCIFVLYRLFSPPHISFHN